MPKADRLGVANVLDVLTGLYGLTEGNLRGDEYDILCPNPAHPDSNPSTSVNLETGLWNCFSCGTAGDLVELGLYMLDLPMEPYRVKQESRKQVLEMLQPRSPDALRVNISRKLAAATAHSTVRQTAASAELGPWEDGPLTALRTRGFARSTLKRWGVQFVPEQELENKEGRMFTIQSSIAIPIRDEHSRLLSWCFRRTDSSPSWQPKYLYPKDADITELWFGLQHHHDAEHITIVEGALDCMWLDQCGYPALALLGSSMGDQKIMALQRYKSITIMGDRDQGGISAVNRIGQMLGDRMPVRIARYPRWMNDDPQDLAGVDVEIVHAKAVSWTNWLMRQGRTA